MHNMVIQISNILEDFDDNKLLQQKMIGDDFPDIIKDSNKNENLTKCDFFVQEMRKDYLEDINRVNM